MLFVCGCYVICSGLRLLVRVCFNGLCYNALFTYLDFALFGFCYVVLLDILLGYLLACCLFVLCLFALVGVSFVWLACCAGFSAFWVCWNDGFDCWLLFLVVAVVIAGFACFVFSCCVCVCGVFLGCFIYCLVFGYLFMLLMFVLVYWFGFAFADFRC